MFSLSGLFFFFPFRSFLFQTFLLHFPPFLLFTSFLPPFLPPFLLFFLLSFPPIFLPSFLFFHFLSLFWTVTYFQIRILSFLLFNGNIL